MKYLKSLLIALVLLPATYAGAEHENAIRHDGVSAETIFLNEARTLFIKKGTGSPEGVVTGNVGSFWIRTDGGTNTTWYKKETGTGNTGWIAVGAGSITGSGTTGKTTRFTAAGAIGDGSCTDDGAGAVACGTGSGGTLEMGTLKLFGSGSGTVTQTGQAAAGTPAVVWGTSSGTPAVTASSPLSLTSATGNITCPTCLTTASTTVPLVFLNAGVPGATACTTQRELWVDTTNDELYHCPNGAGTQPVTVHSKSAAYTLIQGNSGTAAPPAGGGTLNIVGAGTVNCVAADGSPDSVTCTGTGGSTVKNLCRWDAKQGHPPATLFAPLDTMAGTSTPAEVIPIIKFDPDTIWYMDFRCQIPQFYAGGGLTLSIFHSNTTATLEVVWSGAVRRVTLDGVDLDTTAHTYDYNNSAASTVASAVGEVTKTQITFTSGADMDSAAASEYIILRIRRFATDGGDDNTGVSQVHLVVLDET